MPTASRPRRSPRLSNRTTSATGELTRDEILDNITLYWLTNTGVSASRLYWEYKGGFFNAKGVSIPVAVSVFPGEQYQAPRSWTERAYPKLIYYNKVDKGGHFAAWEQPLLFAAEVRAAFRIVTLVEVLTMMTRIIAVVALIAAIGSAPRVAPAQQAGTRRIDLQRHDLSKPPVTLKAGDVLFIPAGTIHAARNVGSGNGAELATYVVDKGKPLVVMVR